MEGIIEEIWHSQEGRSGRGEGNGGIELIFGRLWCCRCRDDPHLYDYRVL